MIPNKILRNNIEEVRKLTEKRGSSLDFSEYQALEDKRKQYQVETEECQMLSNKLSKEVAFAKRNGESADELLKNLSSISARKKELETALKSLLNEIRDFELQVPNLLDDMVPEGADETANKVVSEVGTLPNFEFKPKSHTEICGDDLDFVRAAKISGSRFVFMKGNVAKLHRALAQWMLDRHTQSGYTEINPPLLVEHNALIGTGQLPKFADDQFFTEGQHALIPTAEVSVTNIFADEIVPAANLPISYVALTPCFRKEAGAYGKDTYGLMRLHQFEKVELVKFVAPNQAQEAFDALVQDAEGILQALKLPYRKVLLCAGDTGFSSSITYDLEVWLPGENNYREISSCSYFTDFQARRMSARFRDDENKINLLHTINGSGLAVGRALIAVIENYQTENGNVTIPDVLKDYMGNIDSLYV